MEVLQASRMKSPLPLHLACPVFAKSLSKQKIVVDIVKIHVRLLLWPLLSQIPTLNTFSLSLSPRAPFLFPRSLKLRPSPLPPLQLSRILSRTDCSRNAGDIRAPNRLVHPSSPPRRQRDRHHRLPRAHLHPPQVPRRGARRCLKRPPRTVCLVGCHVRMPSAAGPGG